MKQIKTDVPVNTSNISSGEIIKNYKEFCMLLGEQEKTGGAKNAQLKKWQRYIDFHKDGHKFIIDGIYEEPKNKIDNRSNGNNTIYSEYIKNLIMDLLVHNSMRQNERTLSFSTNRLLRTLEMINTNYVNGKKNIPDFSKALNVDEQCLYDFFTVTHSNLQTALETALNQLKSEVYFTWYKKIVVCIDEAQVEHDATGKFKIHKTTDGKKLLDYTIKQTHRDATEEEEEIILKCKAKALDKLGYKSERHVIVSKAWNLYMKYVNDYLSQKTNIAYFYDAYKLINNREKVKNFAEIRQEWELSKEDKSMQKDELNVLVVYNCEKNSQKRYLKALDKCKDKDIENFTQIDEIRTSDDYLKNQQLFINSFLDNKAKIIVTQ